jgi:hypothetical protein
MSHGTIDDTQKSLKLNAAHRLLPRGTDVAEAADILSRECGISRRRAYRYLKDAGPPVVRTQLPSRWWRQPSKFPAMYCDNCALILPPAG